MGTAGGPKLVTKGLALALDTASPKSYPGSGNVLFDLSGNLDGEIYGSPSFTSNDHGTFDFDGSNDYVGDFADEAIDLIQGQTNFSLGVWFKMDALASLRGLIGTLNYGCTKNLGLVADNTSLRFYNDTTTCNSTTIGAYVETGKWIYAVGTYDGTNTRLYGFKDGTLTTANTTAKSGAANTFVTDFQFWGDQYGPYYTDCKGGIGHVYNRTLTQEEIEQNYNAFKNRFGL